VSLSGFVVAGASLFAFVLLFAVDLFAHHGNPYMGILAYVVSPVFFALGSFLVVLGRWMHRRRVRLEGAAPPSFVIDLSRPRDKRRLVAFIACTLGFLLVTAMGSYDTYHYTESVNFCGQACHGPMKPEFTAYQNGPHARVACSECHVGPGATWYFKSKINGVHQLYCTVVDDYHRPIKTPIKNLRPAQETCEQCHWPQKFVGNLDRTYAHYLMDETNTAFTVRLLLKVGGGDPSRGPANGIHWHMNVANKIEYLATDEQRQTIPWVRTTGKDGTVTEYRLKSFTEDPARYTVRRMDCVDCHNRPAHDYRPPDDLVDQAMSLGRIDPGLHWVKSNAVAVLTAPYGTETEALGKIDASLRGLYAGAPKVDGLVSAVQGMYRENFFPEMKADWRVYPNNIGHKDWAGCFRCHDGLHQTAEGRKIGANDCASCHLILAQGNGAQLDQLNAKGYTFNHIDSEYQDFSCNNCHTGGLPK
jgi:nitrate/TMAO reductase-like tetraheme cytochrome c subunit